MSNGLTEKQRRFVDAYVRLRKGPAAALEAGFCAKWASSSASRLLVQPEIKAAISRRIKAGVDVPSTPSAPESPLEFLLRTMNDPEARAAHRMRAALAAVAFVHAKPTTGSKAAAVAAARRTASGRLAPAAAPTNVVPFGRKP